eukprot:TRINITY_DN36830_c0_g1_i1.p2 TRINITY_DN36830_c0_g1~~TRINITY_DN36830_c0_g1_i1.p2  ORF type:complete len:399 (-),score=71.97 TRINITY_DN36830_c0_g1_i1:37-1233(-)
MSCWADVAFRVAALLLISRCLLESASAAKLSSAAPNDETPPEGRNYAVKQQWPQRPQKRLLMRAEGIRDVTSGHDSDSDADNDDSAGRDWAGRRMVPGNLDEFEMKMRKEVGWERKRESNFTKPLPASLHIVVGVFSCPGDERVRDIHRISWMQQPGVCGINDTIKTRQGQRCQVHVVFIVGKAARSLSEGAKHRTGADTHVPSRLDGDTLIMETLDGEKCYGKRENEDFCAFRRKSAGWFEFASQTFPWATHIGQMDEDYFPSWRKTLPHFSTLKAPYQYIGRTIHGFYCDNSLKEVREHALQNRLPTTRRERIAGKPGQFYCTMGPLFFLSTQLARDMTKPGATYFDFNEVDCYHEDIWVGHSVTEFVVSTGKEVVTTMENDRVNFDAFPRVGQAW